MSALSGNGGVRAVVVECDTMKLLVQCILIYCTFLAPAFAGDVQCTPLEYAPAPVDNPVLKQLKTKKEKAGGADLRCPLSLWYIVFL
jgi:hypothetical protein